MLLRAIREGLDRSRVALDREVELESLRSCYLSLAHRERQGHGTGGLWPVKQQVGAELVISEVTVKAHRGQVKRKMEANSLADLARMTASLRPSRQAIHLV